MNHITNMERFYVYELVNLYGTVEKIGETKNIEKRMRDHFTNKPDGKGKGAFFGRQDLAVNIVANFETKKEAFQFQLELQREYGMTTDIDHSIAIGKAHVESGHLESLRTKEHQSIAGTVSANKLRTCEYCGKENIKQITLNRWHGPSICKNNLNNHVGI